MFRKLIIFVLSRKEVPKAARYSRTALEFTRNDISIFYFEKLKFEDVDISLSVFLILDSIIVLVEMRIFFGQSED